jgi:phosphopantothenate synthetase
MAKTVEPKRSGGKRIVSLKVMLRGTRPPVWRRLLMLGEMTLADLHQAIQATMGCMMTISMPSISVAGSTAIATLPTTSPTKIG